MNLTGLIKFISIILSIDDRINLFLQDIGAHHNFVWYMLKGATRIISFMATHAY